MFEKSSLLVNAFYAKLDQGVVESLIRDADLLYSVVNSRSGRNENMIFYIDRDMNAILGGIEKIGTNLTEDVFYKEHTPVKSNLPTFRLGLEIKKILVVDDNPDIIFTLRSIFEEYPERFLVSTYTNPTEVPHTFQTNYYDLALIDINMPILNGFQLCEKLVDLDANLRICFMSGGEMNQDAIREIYPKISIGCFIKKPIGASELIERVNSQLD
jgi:CheY-like chemotaxis protein